MLVKRKQLVLCRLSRTGNDSCDRDTVHSRLPLGANPALAGSTITLLVPQTIAAGLRCRVAA